MLQKFSWLLAIVFIVVGVLGFVPGVTTSGYFLGIFEVDTLHNIIHLVSGLAFLWAAVSAEKTARMVFQVFGVVYAAVAVVGLIQGGTVLGLISTNMADHILHAVLAVVILYVGFGMKGEKKMMDTPSAPPSGTPTI